ncbi:MAG: hypothetical protein ACP5HM_10840 [Anaerolineae bacterium]
MAKGAENSEVSLQPVGAAASWPQEPVLVAVTLGPHRRRGPAPRPPPPARPAGPAG